MSEIFKGLSPENCISQDSLPQFLASGTYWWEIGGWEERKLPTYTHIHTVVWVAPLTETVSCPSLHFRSTSVSFHGSFRTGSTLFEIPTTVAAAELWSHLLFTYLSSFGVVAAFCCC